MQKQKIICPGHCSPYVDRFNCLRSYEIPMIQIYGVWGETFEYAGIEMDASGDWLAHGGRATISIEGDEFKCKWKLDGNNFVLEERATL